MFIQNVKTTDLMHLQQAASPGEDGGVSGVDDHSMLGNQTQPVKESERDTDVISQCFHVDMITGDDVTAMTPHTPTERT